MNSTSMVNSLLVKREKAMQEYIDRIRKTGNHIPREERIQYTRKITNIDLEIEHLRRCDRI